MQLSPEPESWRCIASSQLVRLIVVFWPALASGVLVVWLFVRHVVTVELPDHFTWISYLLISGVPSLIYGVIEYRRSTKTKLAKQLAHLYLGPIRLAIISIPCWIALTIVLVMINHNPMSGFLLVKIGIPLLIFEMVLGYCVPLIVVSYLFGLKRANRAMAALGVAVLLLSGVFATISGLDFARNRDCRDIEIAEALKQPVRQRQCVRVVGGVRSATSRGGPAYFQHGTVKSFLFSIFNINRSGFGVGVSDGIELALVDKSSGNWINLRFEGKNEVYYWNPTMSLEGLLLAPDDRVMGFNPTSDYVKEFGRQPSALLLVGQGASKLMNRMLKWLLVSSVVMVHLWLCWFLRPTSYARIDSGVVASEVPNTSIDQSR